MSNGRILSKYDGKKLGWFRWWRELLLMIVVVALVFQFVFGITRVSGDSMEPTLHNGNIVFFLRFGDNYKVGDIVAVRMTSGEHYVKRIVAVSGDIVDIKDGCLYVNDTKVSETYGMGKTHAQDNTIEYPYEIEENRYFLLGDNRENSVDSRAFGSLLDKQILGKLISKK